MVTCSAWSLYNFAYIGMHLFLFLCVYWQIVLTPPSIPFLSCHLVNVESIVQVKRSLPVVPKCPWAVQIPCFPNQILWHRAVVGCEMRHSAYPYLFLSLSWDVRMEWLGVLCA